MSLFDELNRRDKYPPEVAKARDKEMNRRSSSAQYAAKTLLARRHKEEYDALYQGFKAEIAESKGPLPGDDDYQEGA